MTIQQIEVPCCNGQAFQINVKSLIHQKKSPYQNIEIYDTELYGKCLLLDGLIQCSEKDHDDYDRFLLKKIKDTDQEILILGGGDGYVAETALKLNPNLKVTVVDLDSDVVNACQTYLGQSVFGHPNVRLVVEDALRFFENVANGSFDGVVCDLTDFPIDLNDQKIRGFYSKVFSSSRRALKTSGWISVYAGIPQFSFTGKVQIIDLFQKELRKNFKEIESLDAQISSFGESCSFLYGVADFDRAKQKAETILEDSDKSLNSILAVIHAAAADGLEGWEDSEEYIQEKLENKKSIHVVLKENDEVVGYMLSIPHNDAVTEMIDADPLLQKDDERYHVMLAEILPGARGKSGFYKLILKTIEEAQKRFHINKFSMHFRVRGDLKRFIQDGFLITKIRRIENWMYYKNGEPTDYIEATCPM